MQGSFQMEKSLHVCPGGLSAAEKAWDRGTGREEADAGRLLCTFLQVKAPPVLGPAVARAPPLLTAQRHGS